jgi:hypothetical protein
MIDFTLIAATAFAVTTWAAPLVVSWTATFAPRWPVTVPFARAVDIARGWAIRPAAVETRRRSWRMRRMW